MFTRIRTRLAALYAGLFAIALSLVAVALYLVVAATAERQLSGELVASGTVFDRLWELRGRELNNAAGVLSRDFGFREAVATGDPGTVGSALDNLEGRLGLRLAFIVNLDGTVIGIADPAMRRDAEGLWSALDAGQTDGVGRIGGEPYRIVAAPIMAPNLAGWVVFTVRLGPEDMRVLERLSAVPITARVLMRAGEGWSGISGDEPSLGPLIERHTGAAEPVRLDTGTGTAIALVKPLQSFGEGERAVLVLRYPLALAMAAYRPLQMAMALTGLVGLILVLIGSWRLSLTLTRPISALDRAAQRMEQGESVELLVETKDEIGRLAGSFNRMAAGIAEREKRITQLAFNDSLTGLPNRAYFRQHLSLKLRQAADRGGLALLCIDLDKFKAVNDTLGHPIGDELLRVVALRLGEAVGNALVARLGGDEFTIILPVDGDSPGALAGRLIAALAEPVQLGGQLLEIGASVGIALAPGDGDDADTLLKHADLALYQAKAEGGGTYRFFESEMNVRAQARHRLEADLRRAIAKGEFELYYQPLFDLASGRIGSFEALLRWNHPERGQVAPDEFIPLAEETGLIVPIGAWVIQEACRQARQWPEDVRVAVNVSSVQFRRPGLIEVILQALAASGLDPRRLEVEITESIFLESSEALIAVLHTLRALGIRIALDDFGTGYSSLSYLQSFPFDKIKIDRSFIQQLLNRSGSTAIVRAITDLARALGMETTAEGVETDAQLDELRLQGCSSAQGFLFSRPIDAAAVHEALSAFNGAQRDVA